MRGGGYKDFTTYLTSLKKINDSAQKYKNLIIRLFIDKNINDDEKIMKYLKNLNKMSIVLFECSDFFLDGFHLSTFGTMVRFFPMFNFKSNDAKRVIVMDADIRQDTLEVILELYDEIIKYKINDVYLVYGGRFNHVNAKKITPIEHKGHTYILPYCIASRVIGVKKIPTNMLTDFLEILIKHINTANPPTKLYDYDIKKEDLPKRCEKIFVTVWMSII
jgi:hypothetical protein